MKIYAFPSHDSKNHTSGVDYARIISPMKALSKVKGFEVEIYKSDKNKEPDNWMRVARWADVVYLNYITNDWAFAAMGLAMRKYGKKIVFDLDDNVFEILKDNVAYETFKKGSKGITIIRAVMDEVDHITTTNDYLKNLIIHHTGIKADKISVFPNYIDLSVYKHKSPKRRAHDIKIGHFGSTSHFASLQDKEFIAGLEMYFRDYPNATFTTVGAFIPKFREKFGRRYINAFGAQDIYKWATEKLPEFADGIDFFVTPLTTNVYNACKSSIKYNEVSSLGKAGIWQDIRQYKAVVRQGETGYLAKTKDEWHKALIKLSDPKEREKCGNNAYKQIKQDWQVQNHVSEYVDMFEKVLDKKD